MKLAPWVSSKCRDCDKDAIVALIYGHKSGVFLCHHHLLLQKSLLEQQLSEIHQVLQSISPKKMAR